MKMLKKIKTDMWISVVMMFLIGILFVVRPQDSLEITAIIAGVIIFVNGIYDLVYYKRAWIDLYSRGTLFEGIMKCILGIFIFTHAGIMTVLFSYVFSIYIIINGIICLETTVYMRRLFHVSQCRICHSVSTCGFGRNHYDVLLTGYSKGSCDHDGNYFHNQCSDRQRDLVSNPENK